MMSKECSSSGLCGLCRANGKNQRYRVCWNPEPDQPLQHTDELPCGHLIDISAYADASRPVTIFADEIQGDFYIETFADLPRVQIPASGELDRFLSCFKSDRLLKSAMQGVYDGTGLGALFDLIEELIPIYYVGIRGMVRARLMTLLVATVPMTGANMVAIRQRMTRVRVDTSEWSSVLVSLTAGR